MKSLLVIGTGSIGKRHIGNFLAAGVERVSGVDTRVDRRSEAKERLPKMAAVYSDYRDALATGMYEAVAITTPPHVHLEMARASASAGCHLFIEKPLGVNSEGWADLAAMLDAKRLKGLVAYCHRFIPYSAIFKEIIDSGRIGRPVHANLVWGSYLPDWHPWEDYRTFYMAKKEQGGGALLDESHGIDLMRYVLGDVASVGAIVDTISDLEMTADDAAFMTMRFRSEVIANACFDLQSHAVRARFEIVGTKGNAVWDRSDDTVRIYEDAKDAWEVQKFEVADRLAMYPRETQHFIDCVDGKAEPAIDVRDGIRTQRVLDAAFESSASGRFVAID